MSKCNGSCGVCKACEFRASRGIKVLPPAPPRGLSNKEFDALALQARGEEIDSKMERIAARAADSDTGARITESIGERAATRDLERGREAAYLRSQGVYE